MAKNAARIPAKIRFISNKSPDYRREFINGAISNVTTRGEIVCDFHFESKDMPTEQVAIPEKDGSGKAKLSEFQEPVTFTRDVQFGIIINASLAEDLIQLLSDKVKESKEVIATRETSKHGDKT